MVQCTAKERKSTRVCIGSLNQKIDLEVRVLTPKSDNDVDYDEIFTQFKTVWAMVETVAGKTMFDKSNIERVVTHNFYIRFIVNITFENWIKYKSQYFDILNVENFGERNSFYKLTTAIRGDDTKPVNWA